MPQKKSEYALVSQTSSLLIALTAAVCASEGNPEFHAHGMMPWPYINTDCKEDQPPFDISVHPLGMPCAEGGSVAMEAKNLPVGIKLCMIFFPPSKSFDIDSAGLFDLALQPQMVEYIDGIETRTASIAAIISECVHEGEIFEAPISLSLIASCIAYRSPTSSDHYFPCRGVAVMPRKARSPNKLSTPRTQPMYSAFTASHGAVFERFVEVEIQTRAVSCGMLQLSIVVNSPVRFSNV